MYLSSLLSLFLLIINFRGLKSNKEKSKTNNIQEYFKSDITKTFMDVWSKYDLAIQSTITSELQNAYGHESNMNEVKMSIAPGFSVSDGNVDLLFKEMVLRELPWIQSQVELTLPSNYLTLQGIVLNSIFVDTNYILFRVGGGGQCRRSMGSPFSGPNVQDEGPLTIVVDGCTVNGSALVQLDGSSVSIRHSNIWLEDCSFTVEISTTGDGKPPIIAPYFTEKKRVELTRLLSQSISEALTMRLKALFYAYIDAQKIFGNEVDNYRNHQDSLFKVTGGLMTSVVANLNKQTIVKNQGTIKLPPSKQFNSNKYGNIKIKDAQLDGLETAYAPGTGGSYLLNKKTILLDTIHFNSLMVNGKVSMGQAAPSTFSAELKDVGINIEVALQNKNITVRFVRWRQLEYFVTGCASSVERQTADAMVSGYISQEVPSAIEKYLSEELPKALSSEMTVLTDSSNEDHKNTHGDSNDDDSIHNKEPDYPTENDDDDDDDDNNTVSDNSKSISNDSSKKSKKTGSPKDKHPKTGPPKEDKHPKTGSPKKDKHPKTLPPKKDKHPKLRVNIRKKTAFPKKGKISKKLSKHLLRTSKSSIKTISRNLKTRKSSNT